MDYRVSPDTTVGFALAGGGTSWSAWHRLERRAADRQLRHHSVRPAYVSRALAFTNNWFTTNRSALGDQVTANFAGQSYGARVEGGYRVPVSIRWT